MFIVLVVWFCFLLFFSLLIRINTVNKIKNFNALLSIWFFLLFCFSLYNLYTGTVVDLYHMVHIGVLEDYFLLIYSILWFAVSIYTTFYFREYLSHHKNLNYYYFFLLLFVFSMFGVIVSSEAITFLIFWELMSVSSYFLVIHEYGKKAVLADGAWYIIITHIWMFFIALSFYPFIAYSHSTYFLDWSNVNLPPSLASLVFFSALIWFGSKAGLFPIHIWLPKAHPIAPTNVSSLMSGFMVKLPVLMLLKVLFIFLHGNVQYLWFVITLLVASISAFLGVFYAIIQHNIKKLLAYHTIENIGIIFLWIAISLLGLYLKNNLIILLWISAALYHTFNHAIFKGLLFLVSWWMIERTWTYEYTKLGGLLKLFPFLWLAFLIWSIAIAGIVPLNGFNSEFLTFVWMFKSIFNTSSIITKFLLLFSVVSLAATAVLSLICFSKVFGIAFLWNQRDKTLSYRIINSSSEKISYSILMITIFILAILPGFVFFVTSKVLGNSYTGNLLTFGDLKLHYVPVYLVTGLIVLGGFTYFVYKKLIKSFKIASVWNCGYPYIDPKTQYTSTSFIQPLRRIFANMYGEIKHIDPKKISEDIEVEYKKNLSHIEYSHKHQYFIDIFYQSLINLILKITIKVKSLQNWQLQTYIFYIFTVLIIGIVLLLVFN